MITLWILLDAGRFNGIDEKLCTLVSGESHSITWEKYGFTMHIPEDAVESSGVCTIAIRAVVSGKFEFPENTEPVSAIYGISTSAKFVKPITLEMQHCVALKQEKDCHYLSFAVSHIQTDQIHLPCSFKKLDGGSFSPGSQYGTILCSSFCLMTTVKDSKGKNNHVQDGISGTGDVTNAGNQPHPDPLDVDSSEPGPTNMQNPGVSELIFSVCISHYCSIICRREKEVLVLHLMIQPGM